MESIIETISKSLGYSSKYVYSKIMCSDNLYLRFSVPKKAKGYRTIYSPSSELKTLQYFVREWYLNKLPISKYATAYTKNKSIITNCSAHIGNKHFLKIDIEDFFDSIPYNGVKNLLMKYSDNVLSEESIELLLKIISRNGRFVQGAVTSPLIANAFCNSMDEEIAGIVQMISNGKYTRYSDDIVVSSDEFIDYKTIIKIFKVIENYGFSLNKNKTVITSNPNSVRITGLNIVNFRKIRLGTYRKKQINSDIYYKLKFNDNRCKSTEEIIGNLMFVKMVEPYYYNFLNNKYSRNGKTLLSILREID